MAYKLYRELLDLTEEFEKEFPDTNNKPVAKFANWLHDKVFSEGLREDPNWEGKETGRSAESVINTLLIHLYRYARIYGKMAIATSTFITIDDVIFLINLRHLGSMTKIELIERNIQEKSTGIQIINRLLKAGYISEDINPRDKRSKTISITTEGASALEKIMSRIREASKIVTGDLTENEKLQLILLLQKLETFHRAGIRKLSPEELHK